MSLLDQMWVGYLAWAVLGVCAVASFLVEAAKPGKPGEEDE